MQWVNPFLSFLDSIYLRSHNRMNPWLLRKAWWNRGIIIKIPAEHNSYRNSLKALSYVLFQTNFSSFFNKFLRGLVILEKFGINICNILHVLKLFYVITSLWLWKFLYGLPFTIYKESGFVPSLPNTYPK